MADTYTPRPGSVPWRVIRFLTQNPDEELTRGDVAVKFDALGTQVDTQLSTAVNKGVLKRGRNSESELVWMADNLKKATLEPWPDEPVRQAQTLTQAVASMHSGERDDGIAGMPRIRPNTPLMVSAAEKRAAERHRHEAAWDEWLGDFEVRSSAEFPAQRVKEFRTQARRYSRENKTKFRIAEVRDGVCGIERMK